jgi:hypothetical protein
MNLLPRRLRLATLLATLLIVPALPVTWTDQAPLHGIAPALSHAGGSPDETLNPPSTPPQSGSSVTPKRAPPRPKLSSETTRVTRAVDRSDLSRVDWLLVWKISLTSVVRF